MVASKSKHKKLTKQSSFLARRGKASSRGKTAPTERPGIEGGLRDTNRKKRVFSLEKAGLALFLAHGVDGVTVDALAASAQMAKGSFYRYFDDVEALLAHLLAPVELGLQTAFSDCESKLRDARTKRELVEAYQSLAFALATTVLSAQDVVRLYLQESRGAPSGARRPIARLAREVRARALSLTEAAHRHGLQRPVPPLVSAHAVVGAAEELVFIALSGREIGEPAEVASALIELVLDGVRAR